MTMGIQSVETDHHELGVAPRTGPESGWTEWHRPKLPYVKSAMLRSALGRYINDLWSCKAREIYVLVCMFMCVCACEYAHTSVSSVTEFSALLPPLVHC